MKYGIQNILIRRSIAIVNLGLIMTALAITTPATKRRLTSAGALPLQGPVVTANFTDQEVPANFSLSFTLNRPLPATEGRLAVLIGKTDFTNLFAQTGNAFTYLPQILPLPAGESPVRVFLVSAANEWREVAQFKLRVMAESSADPAQAGQPGGAPSKKATAGKYIITPSLTLGMKSQVAERHFPQSNRPERPTFADVTLQGSLKSEITRNWFNNQMQFEMVGSSYQKEALRFAQRGADAPPIDLSNYLMQFQLSKARLQVGHIAIGTNRHLITAT